MIAGNIAAISMPGKIVPLSPAAAAAVGSVCMGLLSPVNRAKATASSCWKTLVKVNLVMLLVQQPTPAAVKAPGVRGCNLLLSNLNIAVNCKESTIIPLSAREEYAGHASSHAS
jgi:hypothetical protein